MRPSALKSNLTKCLEKPPSFFTAHDFSIGHRGACMQFPEHTNESFIAAITMGRRALGTAITNCRTALRTE